MSIGDKPRLLVDSVVIGVIGGLSAQLFMWMLRLSSNLFLGQIAGYSAPGLAVEGHSLQQVIGPHGLWLIPLVTTLGGVLSGIIVYGFAPEAEGHGTDTAVKAVHWTAGKIRARVAPVKMIASAITIGSGGSAGREGPTALISAGFGSIYADVLHRPERERRMLVLMGMAAGLSAIFRSPIGTALFAVEVLYGGVEFEAEALLYCMLAAIVAYAVNGTFSGWYPLFQIPAQAGAKGLTDFGWYTLLGLASGVAGTILPEIFYRLRDAFLAIHIPQWTKPAIGGLLLGIMGLGLPQVLGGGYGWIQEAIDGHLALHLMLILVIAKMVAMSLSVSSGGSGGVFAPSLFIGSMMGGVFASIAHQPAAGMVVVGMGAVFAGAARVPIATLLMVAEMTGGYRLLVPAGLAVTLSYLVQLKLSSFCKYGSLYEGQVPRRVDSPAHRVEHIRIALRLLAQGKASLSPEISRLNIAALLQSGVALEVRDGVQLMIGALRPESTWVGKSIADCEENEAMREAHLVAVLRGQTTIFPRRQTLLQPGDRLLIIAPQSAHADLAVHLAGPNELAKRTSPHPVEAA